MLRWGMDETKGVVIGGGDTTGTLHNYKDGAQQGPTIYGENDDDVKRQAAEWFRANGGPTAWPDGLELRLR